jgi:hypothetical protein
LVTFLGQAKKVTRQQGEKECSNEERPFVLITLLLDLADTVA